MLHLNLTVKVLMNALPQNHPLVAANPSSDMEASGEVSFLELSKPTYSFKTSVTMKL